MRTRTGTNIFLYIADVVAVDLPDKLAQQHRTAPPNNNTFALAHVRVLPFVILLTYWAGLYG